MGPTTFRPASPTDGYSLLSDEEITAAIGSVPASEPTEPAGPFTGRKWGSGLLFVQMAPFATLIAAPAEHRLPIGRAR